MVWSRKQLKRHARETVRRSYWRTVIVCFLMFFLVGAYGASTMGSGNTYEVLLTGEILPSHYRTATNTEIVNAFVHNIPTGQTQIIEEASKFTQASEGILAGFFNNITQSGSFLFGILNALNQFIFKDSIMAGVIILVGAVLTFLYWLFVGNVLRVGECRYFLENRSYPQAQVNRILLVFKVRRTRSVAKVMFLRTLYSLLWMFTIVGGPIKYYSYRMVPYLLAENPDLSHREAMGLSRRMMNGQKWSAFKLDASFLGWSLLSSLSMGILDILFGNPYRAATGAELYMALRADMIEKEPATLAIFCDRYLEGHAGGVQAEEYPVRQFHISEAPGRRWLSLDYHRKYSAPNIILLFFTFAFVGWVWEVLVDLINTGHFVNRGTLFGPWLPLYGFGGVFIILLLRRWVDRPVLTFFLAVAICGVMEYFTAWALETFANAKWWDYSGYFMNIHGRVCLEGLLVFGLAGSVGVYMLGPILDEAYGKVPKAVRIALCAGLLLCFAVDLVFSAQHPNMAAASAF